MNWTTSSDLRKKLGRWWDSGKLLKAEFTPESFPLQMKLKGPTTRQLGSDFGKVSDWIKRLEGDDVPLCYVETRHRVIGTNRVPTHAVFESLERVAVFLKKGRDLARFRELLALTQNKRPELLEWVARHPNRLLELADDWGGLMMVVQWMEENPRPEVYLRQVDLPGIDTKFLEKYKKLLARLLRLSATVNPGEPASFEGEFGFLERPARVRFRLLDESPHYPPGLTDLTLTTEEFSQRDPGLRLAFILENEINFLSFPIVKESLVIFGSGYEVGNLKRLDWLNGYQIYYWGDIDTHGFAILNRLRAHFPHAHSFLMDQETLLAHRSAWVTEPHPTSTPLERLTRGEQELYQALLTGKYGDSVRLEQELIGYSLVLNKLANLPKSLSTHAPCSCEPKILTEHRRIM